MHLAINRTGGFDSEGVYVPVHRGSSWASAWSLKEEMTYGADEGVYMWQDRLVADRDDDVHYISEIFFTHDHPWIQYKRRTHPNWGTAYPTIVVGDPEAAWGDESANPDLYLRETETGDTLNLVYSRTVGELPYWTCFTRKAVDASDSAWQAESFVSRRFTSVPTVQVDEAGTVHVLGSKKTFSGGQPDSLFMWALRGTDPGPGEIWSDTTWVLLDAYKLPPYALVQPAAGEPGDPGTQPPSIASVGDEYLYAAWGGWVTYEGAQIGESFLARYDVSNQQWSEPIQVTPNDSLESAVVALTAAPNGTLHLLYNDPMGAGAQRLRRDGQLARVPSVQCWRSALA